MDKDILIHIEASQTDTDNVQSSMEFYAEGKLYKKQSSIYITYLESEITGMEGTKTTLKIEGDSITLIRFGNINTRLFFIKDKKTSNRYETDFALFDISILTRVMEINILEGEPSMIKLEYELYFDDENYYSNKLSLSFKN